MSKKKPPYVLGALIMICLCAVVFIGLRFAKTAGDPDQAQDQPKAPDTPVGQPRPTDSPSVIAQQQRGVKPTGMKPLPPGKELPPSILIPKATTYKPRPDSADTGSLGPVRTDGEPQTTR